MRIDIATPPLRPLPPTLAPSGLAGEELSPAKATSQLEKSSAIVRLGETPSQTGVQTYTRAMLRPTTAVEDISRPEPSSIFSSGQNIDGVYGNGKFKTENGEVGEYFALNNGKIGFTIDGFHGVLTGNRAIAYNPETEEFYSMYIKYEDGKFRITDIQPGKVELPPPGGRKPIFTEGEHRGVRVAHNESGELKIGIYQSETGEWLEGRGVLNPDGTFLIRFSNGRDFTGHYGFDANGKLLIFDREASDSGA